jgi:hypothetical protein
MRAASIIINAIIFVTTLIIALSHFRKDGKWQIRDGMRQFRYFTVLSNDFCAITALIMAVSQLMGSVPRPVFLLKYLGTVALTLTFVTVFLFLMPFQGGYKRWLTGDSFFAHLITPLLAVLSLCLIERQKMTLGTAMLGLVPVILYGAVYFYKVMLAPEKERWEDFYGFNRGGKWPIVCAVMLVATSLLCVLLWWICGM